MFHRATANERIQMAQGFRERRANAIAKVKKKAARKARRKAEPFLIRKALKPLASVSGQTGPMERMVKMTVVEAGKL